MALSIISKFYLINFAPVGETGPILADLPEKLDVGREKTRPQ
jgi:hypothetical protein